MYLYLYNIYNIEEKDIYNINKKSNILRFILSIKMIIYTKNKLSFCSITTNWEEVVITEIRSGNR